MDYVRILGGKMARNLRLLLTQLLSIAALFGIVQGSAFAQSSSPTLPAGLTQTTPTPFRVGGILALSGDGAAMGQAFRNGFQLGLDKLPAAIRDQIKVQFEDDALSAKNAVSAFRKLESEGGVDLVFSFFSGSALALSPIIESKGVTMLAIAADPNVVKGKKYAFNFWMTPDIATEAFIAEAKKRGYKKIGRVSASHSGVAAYKDSFDRLNNGRLTVAVDEEFSPEARDFRSFVSKLKGKGELDAVLVILLPGQIGLFTKQARQGGFLKDFIGVELFEDKGEVASSDGAMINQWYVNSDSPTEEFQRDYQARFPNSSQYSAANGYDAALLLGDALSKGHTKSTMYTYFQNVKDFHGALGTYSSTGDQRFTLPAAIKVVKTNGFEKLQQ
jgi:ABC-type branched-subunit amino acid transport system substrate-binding protein